MAFSVFRDLEGFHIIPDAHWQNHEFPFIDTQTNPIAAKRKALELAEGLHHAMFEKLEFVPDGKLHFSGPASCPGGSGKIAKRARARGVDRQRGVIKIDSIEQVVGRDAEL